MDKLLIWDIDGTLINGSGTGKKAMNTAFSLLYGIEGGLDAIDLAGRLDSSILLEAYKIHGLPEQNISRFYDEYCIYLKEYIENLGFSIVLPGVVRLLEVTLKKEGCYNALGTGNIERGARIKLSFDDLNKFFPVGGFGDEAKERFQVIENAISNSCDYYNKNFEKQNIYVIGDTPKDIECAVLLGTKSIGVATGRYTQNELIEAGSYKVLENLENPDSFFEILTS